LNSTRSSKRFGEHEALQDTTFSIHPGEFMTFLGPSGSGKTTCLRLIGGFETPTSGRVLIDGKDVTFDPPYRRDVNQVFQNYALFPHLSIYENIAFGLRMKRLAQAEISRRVDRVVEMTSLWRFCEPKTGESFWRPASASRLGAGHRLRTQSSSPR
jgi:spermidine/putrescine transport system ATP-binding protein